jgi:trehalose 6-phosphate synthase
MWVGYPSLDIEDPAEHEEVRAELMKHHCIPMFLDPAMLLKQQKFCDKILYPLFHNIIGTAPDVIPVYDDVLWQAYRNVNAELADKIKEHYANAGVWVHDYCCCPTLSLR